MQFKKLFWFQMLFLVWVLFATLYVAYGEWNRFRTGVMQRSYQQGFQLAVTQVMTEAKKCQPFPVNQGQESVNLISVDCLKKSEEATKKK